MIVTNVHFYHGIILAIKFEGMVREFDDGFLTRAQIAFALMVISFVLVIWFRPQSVNQKVNIVSVSQLIQKHC